MCWRQRFTIIRVICGIHVLETEIYNYSSYPWNTCVGDRDLQLFELSVEDMCWRPRSTINCSSYPWNTCVGDRDIQLFDLSAEDMCWRHGSTIVRGICGRHVLETEIYNCSSYPWNTCVGDMDLQFVELTAEYM
jgi:hypothetical protein